MEEAIRLGGYQTLPLGRDRHGRFYYRFPGDSRRVFVSHAIGEEDEGRSGDTSSLPSVAKVGGSSRDDDVARQELLELPKTPSPEDLMVYENDGDVETLVEWLHESGQREGPLRAALLRAFPPSRRATRALAATTDAHGPTPLDKDKNSDKDNDRGNDVGHVKIEGDAVMPRGDEEGEAAGARGRSNDEGEEVSGRERQETGAVEATGTSAGGGKGGGRGRRSGGRRQEDRGVLARPSRNQELPRLLEEGLVELRIALNPPGGQNNVLVPVSESVVEYDHDGEVDEVRRRAPGFAGVFGSCFECTPGQGDIYGGGCWC